MWGRVLSKLAECSMQGDAPDNVANMVDVVPVVP